MVVYTPVTEQGVWGIRTNQELRKVYKGPELVAELEAVWACNKNGYNKND
jgi:hypothetical protein